MNDTVERFMTPSIYLIGIKRTLAEAHRLMNEHSIRHLPVIEGGKLVGMVSQRDLHLVETLRDVDPEEVKVEEAMSQDAFVVSPTARVGKVAARMARHRLGSAVVAQRGRILGIFTTTDALRALAVLDRERTKPKTKAKRAATARRA